MDTLKIREQVFARCKDDVKTKGAYEVAEFTKYGWHKNQSSMVIPISVVAHLLDYCDYREFIKFHTDEFDFMLRTKVDRSSRLVLVMKDGLEIPQQNICRYYPTTIGGKLVKIMPPLPDKIEAGERRLSIDAEWDVKTCNNMKEFSWEGMNYDYYIAEATKLLEGIFGEGNIK